MSTALVLAGAGSGDGLLEAREVLDLDLRAPLVILSACETGSGRVTRGEGIVGLSWSWFVAGAPTVIVSRWRVDSESARQVMLAYHRARTRGARSEAIALRAAALPALRGTHYRHPYHWAAFSVLGASH